jgi:L-amino acid N-acyltransferase YncA
LTIDRHPPELLLIRDARPADAEAIAAVYNPYIAGSTISFEEDPVSADDMRGRIAAVQDGALPWLVLETADGTLAGYAYATKWRVRHAYRFSVETSVYLAQGSTGHGHGAALYTALLQRLRDAGCHLAIGGIALPNQASVALHEKMGFKKVAHFGEVGCKFGGWIDVGYWQLTLQAAPVTCAPPPGSAARPGMPDTAAPPSATSPSVR